MKTQPSFKADLETRTGSWGAQAQPFGIKGDDPVLLNYERCMQLCSHEQSNPKVNPTAEVITSNELF